MSLEPLLRHQLRFKAESTQKKVYRKQIWIFHAHGVTLFVSADPVTRLNISVSALSVSAPMILIITRLWRYQAKIHTSNTPRRGIYFCVTCV